MNADRNAAPASEPARAVRDTDRGEFLVETFTGSVYALDLDLRVISRYVGDGGGVLFAPSGLRKDGLPIPLLSIVLCEVEKPAVFWVQVREDRTPTLRTTSPVTSISRPGQSPRFSGNL
jgi:hypothetical protein